MINNHFWAPSSALQFYYISLFKMFCHLIKLLFGSAEQTLRVIPDPALSITLHFQPDRNLYDFISQEPSKLVLFLPFLISLP